MGRPRAFAAVRLHPLVTVDVWVAPLLIPDHAVRACARVLAEDEAARAARFYFEPDRRRFIVARSTLRHLLAGYLDCRADGVAFTYGARGKPAVSGLEFNLSHSGEIAVYAFHRGGAVGIDVEHCRPMPDALQIAERFFSAEERVALRALPAPRREAGFFTCWTRKEAYIKVLGDGLFTSLDRFVVTLEGPARLVRDEADAQAGQRYVAWSFDPEPGYIAAIMVEVPVPGSAADGGPDAQLKSQGTLWERPLGVDTGQDELPFHELTAAQGTLGGQDVPGGAAEKSGEPAFRLRRVVLR